MAKLFIFSVFCIFQLCSLSLNMPPLYANHLCSHHQSLSLLNFKESLQIKSDYRGTCTSEFGLYGTTYNDPYCDGSFNPIVESKISSWNSSTDCCSWEGVTCDEFTGKVVELDLSLSRLSGEINSNSSIFHLSHLKRLNLAYNFLDSKISPEFGRFTHLSHLNLSSTGFAGQIPSEISQLNELVSLDLSNYKYSLEPHVFKVLQNMSKLRELYLEGVDITSSLPNNLSTSLTILSLAATHLKGAFPYQLFHLPNLKQLSLGKNSFDGFGSLTSFTWNTSSPLWKLELPEISISKKLLDTVGNLKHLAYLDLSSCLLNGTLPQSFGNLTQLSHLDLSDNYFSGQIPQGIFGLEHLTFLDIGSNNFDAPIPHSSSNNLRNLEVLSLPYNKLTTTCVSSFLSNLTRLETIDLSFNPLYEVPFDLFKLAFLQKINLGYTHLHGPIPQSFSKLVNLKYLNLESNQLSGPTKIDTLPNNLTYLNLASNNFTGPIGMHAFSKLVNLKYFNLASNKFMGPIEIDAFSNLVNLITLDLSSNNFDCDLDVRFLSNIKRMEGLNLSFSSLSLTKESNNTLPTISINSLVLDSCNIRDLDVLRSIIVEEDLHLSNNNIHGEIPEWAWSNWYSITILDLSNNFITHIGSKIPLQRLKSLDIGSNLLQGELPDVVGYFGILSLPNNQLHGEIKSTICEQSIYIVDLSNNSLTGALPDCISNVEFLDLHMNNLQGTIPDTFLILSTSLNLRDNHLEGNIPRSLINASYLKFLDLSENNLTDAFPVWLGDLPLLQYLSLRSNNLYGPISSSYASEYGFSGLKILDISYNQLNGDFPARLLKGFKGMMSASGTSYYSAFWYGDLASQHYYDSTTMVMNGITVHLDRISDAMRIIDISCNHFEGEIPSSIGGLIGIQQLNLSHNNFTGQIPPQLGNLSNLQSLGLSHNQLEGCIPHQLAYLGFLSVLNLSYNHLTGKIPTGPQLQTIANDSYIGNDGLCGLPLLRKCGNDNATTHVEVPDEEDHQEFLDGFTWQSVMVGYGVGICIGFVIGIIMLFNEKPKWLIKIFMEEAQRIGYKYKKRNGSVWNITS